MNSQEERKFKASQIEAMQNRNGIDNWPFPQPKGWVAQWDPEGLAQALNKEEQGNTSPDSCSKSSVKPGE
ncbi:MAG: hypothetical protein P1S60_14125 [Anaerolineae bacterium]|nr:hypothetical protein [Anaerolineae bacterium]